MTSDQLVKALKDAYASAPKGDKVVAVHLFGIRFSDELKGHSTHEIAERAGISKSYGTELRKGMRLAPHVSIR